MLEALGEAGGLCTARPVASDGDVIVCRTDAERTSGGADVARHRHLAVLLDPARATDGPSR
ncbi:hypothetical protein DBP20_09760 [Streptomyces sp. CS131]|nr:hypothetical protein DBP20_09760 [Streptomyces sp. CS131]